MDANDQGWRTGADAAPPAERRATGERRSRGRRRADRSLADPAPDAPAGPGAPFPDAPSNAWLPGTGPAGNEAANSAPAGMKAAVIRKYHFRSFDDRRLGIDRRTPPGADDGRLSADEVASLLREEE
jgi:hypothetical protein